MDEVLECLDCCYRKDNYRIYDMVSKDIVNFSEYFMVAGDHCIIKVIDVDYAFVYVNIFNARLYRTKISLEDVSPYDALNSMFDHFMAYDYLITQLKKMSPKEAKNSPLKELKSRVETAIDTGDFDEEDICGLLGMKTYQEAKAHCQYLAYAYDLEWRGVIDLDTCKKFDNIEELDKFVVENDLINKPMGKSKQKDVLAFNFVDYQNYDRLNRVRENGDMLSYYTRHGLTLKDAKALRLADVKSIQNIKKAYRFAQIVGKYDEKMFFAKSEKEAEKIKNKEIKYVEKVKDVTAQDVFFALGPECNM